MDTDMSNTHIWDALGKTDPAATKGFSRAGGFKGTAVKPMWILRRLTEQFGPAGEGWGVGEPQFTVVNGEGEILVYCTVSAWHGCKENTLWGVGGDKVLSRRKDGQAFHDDEAFKKAFTDAVSNAFKSIGVAADIHMGMFDDSKYVSAMEREFAPKVETVNEGHLKSIRETARKAGITEAAICKSVRVERLEDLPVDRYQRLIDKLNITIAEKEAV